MLPLTSFTAPVGSAVLPCVTSDATRLGASFNGVTRLNGCEPVSVVPKESALFSGTDRGQLAVGRGLSHAHRAVMATQAQAAGDAQRRLRVALVGIGRAGVGRVGFLRQLLVPQRGDAAQSAVRSMAESAAQASLRIDRRATATASGCACPAHPPAGLRLRRNSAATISTAGQRQERLHGCFLPSAAWATP